MQLDMARYSLFDMSNKYYLLTYLLNFTVTQIHRLDRITFFASVKADLYMNTCVHADVAESMVSTPHQLQLPTLYGPNGSRFRLYG